MVPTSKQQAISTVSSKEQINVPASAGLNPKLTLKKTKTNTFAKKNVNKANFLLALNQKIS